MAQVSAVGPLAIALIPRRRQNQSSPKFSKLLDKNPGSQFSAIRHSFSEFLSSQRERSIMAGGGNFIQRVVSYVANELIVNGLANSPAFQRFAVRTSKRIEDLSVKAAQVKKEVAEQVKDISKNMESFKNQ